MASMGHSYLLLQNVDSFSFREKKGKEKKNKITENILLSGKNPGNREGV
jgi:hypothetical protein